MAGNKKKRVAVDLVPIRPGKSGTGSGIWTVARELVLHFDKSDAFPDLEIFCLISREQRPFFSGRKKVRFAVFPCFGKTNFLRLVWVHLLLPVWCLFRRINVIHKLATEVPLLCSARRVTTVHDFYHEFIKENGYECGPSNRYFRWMSSVCFRKSRVVITVSDSTLAEAGRRFPETGAEMTTVYNGVEYFVPKPVSAVSAEEIFTILYVAKLMPYKGQMQALNGLRALLGKHPEVKGAVRLIIHGFPNHAAYEQALKKEAAASLFKSCVEFRDYAADMTTDCIYTGADAVLLLSEYEGFGLPVVEAQALGIPVICSELDVLREVGGDGALYADRNDPDRVADALYRIMQNPDERTRLIEAGRKNAQRFQWSEAARQTIEVYRKVSA